MVFKGFKSLNRIQSIVYDMAYNTNENLLVAAPTGAGKTNIALLTITHEIRNNIKEDVLKKDSFKVLILFIVFSLLVQQNFTTAGKSSNFLLTYLKVFFIRHSSEYESSDSDQKVNQNI